MVVTQAGPGGVKLALRAAAVQKAAAAHAQAQSLANQSVINKLSLLQKVSCLFLSASAIILPAELFSSIPQIMADDTEITSPFAMAAVPPPPPVPTQISTSPFVLQAAAATVTASSALTQLNVPAGNFNVSTSPFVAQDAEASTLESRQTQDDVPSSTSPFVLAACMVEMFEFAYRVG